MGLTTGVGFNKEEFKAMTKDEKTKLQAARQAGLNTVKAILDDVNFYEKGIATPREKRAKMLREAEAKGMPPGGEFTMNNGEVRKQTFERYQTIMKSPDKRNSLRLQTPPSSLLADVREEQKVKLVEEGIRASVGKNRKAGMVRRTIVQWMMLGQKQAIVEWQIKMKAEANREKVLLRSLRRCGKVPLLLRVLDWWFLFSIKRPLTRFYNNFRLEMKAEELRREALRAAHMKKVAAFAVEFVAAVDEDGDGGLSLNELKNNEV